MKHKWIGVVAVAFLFLFIAVIPASADVPPTWSPPVNVSVSSQHAASPQLVSVPGGALATVWDGFDGTNNAVEVSHSTDGGVTWASPVTLSAAETVPSFPQIVAAPDGSLTAVWMLANGVSLTVQASHSVNGTSWSVPLTLTMFSGEASSPRVVAAPDGSVTAIWQGQGSVVQSSHSVDGISWSAPSTFPDAGWGGVSPHISSAPDGSLTGVWSSFNGSSYTIQASHSVDGSSWSVPVQVTIAGNAASDPQSVAGPGNTVTVVWDRTDGSNGVIQSSHSVDGGLNWDAPTTLSIVGAGVPVIALGQNGTIAVAWDRFDGANYSVQSSHSTDGASWSAAADLSPTGQDANGPEVVAGSPGSWLVVWSLSEGSSAAIQSRYSADDGASWEPALTLSSLAPGATAPQIVTRTDGADTAVWSLFDGTNYSVQSSSTSATLPAPSLPEPVPAEPGAVSSIVPRPVATASVTPTPQPSPSPFIVDPVLTLAFDFTIGDHAGGGGLTVTGNGFQPDSLAVVTLHSKPTVLGTLPISSGGSFAQSMTLPTDLEAGVHHIEVSYTGANGSPTSQSLYFSVDRSDVVTHMQTEPTATAPAWANQAPHSLVPPPDTLTVGGVTYPVYRPAEHATQAVDTVVFSLVLLTILGGVGAVSTFAAGGSIALAAAAAAAGGTREARSSSEGGASASLASAKVKHLKFKSEAVARGDRSSTWDWPGSDRLDSLSAALPVAVNRFSPLLARVSNDGAYLRAMFGPLWLVSSLAGIILGALGVASTNGAAVPPSIGLMIAIIVLSAFDVMGGLLAAGTFTIGVIALGGLGTIAEARTLLGIDVILFTVALTASAARPLRRLPALSASDWFDRMADVVIASLIATWAVTKMVGALPALSGIALPLANSAFVLGLFAGGAVVLRYILETVATYHYPLRLASVAPPRIGFPSIRQQLVSAVGKTALFVFIAIAYLGNIWPLWIGAALFLIPSVVATFQGRLPNVPRLVRFIPGGVIKIVLMLCIGKVLGGWLASVFHTPQEFINQAFVILSLPPLLLGFAGFFGREGKTWLLTWPLRMGGVVLVIVGVLLVFGAIRIP